MQAPVPMFTGAGGSKAAVVVAILIGLFVVNAMKKQTTTITPAK